MAIVALLVAEKKRCLRKDRNLVLMLAKVETAVRGAMKRRLEVVEPESLAEKGQPC